MIEIKDSAVLRDGVQIGVIDGDTCNSTAIISGIIKGQIRKAAGNPDLAFAIVEAQVKEIMHEGEKAVVVSSVSKPDSTSSLSVLPRLIAETEAQVIPPPPPTRPDMGDKTPAYVEWFRRYSTPEEFEKKYPTNRRLCSEAQADEGARMQQRKIDLNSGFDSTTGKAIELKPIQV